MKLLFLLLLSLLGQFFSNIPKYTFLSLREFCEEQIMAGRIKFWLLVTGKNPKTGESSSEQNREPNNSTRVYGVESRIEPRSHCANPVP